MKADEAADTIGEAHESTNGTESFRRRVAILIGVLAMLLAISGLGGQNAAKEMVNSNILASDAYAFYQAKNIRQTAYLLAADELEILLLTQKELPEDVRGVIQGKIERYKRTMARYESEPETGDGKKELLAKAKTFEAQREHARAQDPNFDLSEALLQIAIVLCSVSIVAASAPLAMIGAAFGAIATVLMINGFFLFVHLPIG
jgi:hypothetical protein